jgi:hypothetical protein
MTSATSVRGMTGMAGLAVNIAVTIIDRRESQ